MPGEKQYIEPEYEVSDQERHNQLVELFEKLTDSIDKLSEAEHFDKELGIRIKEVVKEVIAINKPITQTLSEISNQNKSIIEFVGRLLLEKKDDSKYIELITRLNSMIEKSNEFIEKGIKNVDYTKALNAIADRLEKKEVVYFIDNIKGRRNPNTGIREIESMTITAKPQNLL